MLILVEMLLQCDVLSLELLESLHDVLLDVVSQLKLWPCY